MNDQMLQSSTDQICKVRIDARPEPIELVPSHTAVVVVDLQNGYASPGGYRHLIGQDVGPARVAVANALRLLDVARAAGVTVIMLKNGWDAELKTAGGPNSPNWHKSNPLKTMRARPELKGKILTHGSWDYEFVDELKPVPSDIIVPKARYSGFCGTALDNILRARDIRHLVFAGIATNVCVEFDDPRCLPSRVLLYPGRRRHPTVRPCVHPGCHALQRGAVFGLGHHDRRGLPRALGEGRVAARSDRARGPGFDPTRRLFALGCGTRGI